MPLTVSITTQDANIQENESVDFDIVFSESVMITLAGNITVTGGTANSLTGSGTDYVLSITAGSGVGTIVIGVIAGETYRTTEVDGDLFFIDGDGDHLIFRGEAGSTVSDSASFTRSAIPRTVMIAIAPTDIIGGQAAEATLTFNANVTGLAIGDLSVSAGTLSNFVVVSGTTYTVEIQAPSTGSGTLTLTLAEDAVNEGNAEATASATYSQFIVTWSNVPTDTVDNTFMARLNFSHVVSGLTAADINLERSSGTDNQPDSRALTDAEVTITQITGTNNYILAFDLGNS